MITGVPKNYHRDALEGKYTGEVDHPELYEDIGKFRVKPFISAF